MKKRLLLRWLQCRAAMLVTLLGASLGLNAEDKFYIPDFDIAAGESKQIAIHYESSEIDKRCGFQFDLYLPEGLTVEKKKNKYNFTFNTDRNDDHTMSSSDQPDGAIRVVGISMSSAQFWEAAGEFIYFNVTAASDFAGSHEITISEIQFSDLKGTLIPVADSKTVINPGGGEIPATGITLDQITAELTEGETLTLTATVTPEDATDKTVTWTSSDETVATVANGVVTALKAGKVTITAKSGEVSATCEITVNAKVIPATGITLDKTTAELTEGETLTLTATVSPEDATDKTVVWTSSNETVATVANGVVTALKAGKATITAKAGEVSATCELTVNAKVIPATNITLDKTTAELTEGETLTLTATVTPEDATDKTVTWTSSDETVATVANGVVTALKAGKATITAKAGEVSATCELTVNAKVIPATGIALDKTTAELTEGETLTLTATVIPEDATDKTVTWTSSDETVATVANGVVTALKAGKATITAANGGNTATCELTVNAKMSDDRFYISDFEIAAGESKQIAIYYESSEIDKRCGFQFDLYLPEGLTVEKKKNKYNFTFNTDRNDDHTMSSSDQPDGAIRVVGISMSSAQFWEAAGEFIYFTVTAASDFTGSHEVRLSGVQFSTLTGTLIPIADSKATITGKTNAIPATGIALDKTTAELTEGETLTLTATVTPEDATDKTVTWTSSDETVATVKDGVVTALKAGKVTITAKAGEVSASCEVIVVAAEPEAPVWRDFQIDLTAYNDPSSLLTADEIANNANFEFGINVAEDGTLSRVEATDATANAVISGKYHNDHGCTGVKVVIPVYGPTKIGVGSCTYSGSDAKVTDADGKVVATFANNKLGCWSRKKTDEAMAFAYYDGEATTLTIESSSYTPAVSFKAIKSEDIPHNMVVEYALGESGATGVLPAGFEINAGEKFAIPTNTTLYVEGKTLTGWTDGTKTYAIGEEITAIADTQMSLTPVFTANEAALADRTETVTIKWNFRADQGATRVGFQGNKGIYVAQAVVNGKTIDVKMDIDATSGKFNNLGHNDWVQINKNTKLTIPSCKGAVVTMETYLATTTTTVAGEIINQETKTPTYTYNGTSETIDVVIGDGSYFRYVQVVLPVIELSTAVTGIALDKTTAELTEGETLTLTATVTPDDATDKTVTWTSSDETVATVKDGVVTALKAGKATITAKAGEVSATCEITVNAKVIPATNITLDKTTAELTEGETLTLTATVTPEDATDKTVTWTSSDETVATVKDGVVTALKAGKVTITAKAGEVSATCEITVVPATGIDSITTEEKIASGNVYTINGVKVLQAGEPLDKLSKGLYIINGKKVVVK